MYTITLLIGLVCGGAANLPDSQCRTPHTAIQVRYNATKAEAAEELKTCEAAAEILRGEIRKRNRSDEALAYCDQRSMGGNPL